MIKYLQGIFLTAVAVAVALLAGRGFLYAFLRKDAVRRFEEAMVAERLERAQNWTGFTLALQQTIVALLIVLAVVAALFGLAAVAAFVVRQQRRANQVHAEHGQYPLLWMPGPDGTRLLVDPAMMASAGILSGAAGVQLLPAPADASPVELRRIAASVARTAAARGSGDFRIPNQATGRFLTGALDPKPLPPRITVEPPLALPPAAPPRLLTVGSALAESGPTRWIVGQNPDSGALATFDRTRHAHAGIVGSTGTGKTTSLGFTLAAAAIAAGCQVVILDPDDGANWSHFAPVCEWHPTDALTFPDQFAAVYAEFERRRAAPGQEHRPLVVFIEEYGDLTRQLRQRNRPAAQQVDAWMDTILVRGRKAGISMVLIDQYPEHWSQPVISGVKRLFVFKLGPNQGSKVGAYEAQNLPDVGVFLLANEGKFASFDTTGRVPTIVRALPPRPRERIVEGDFKRLEDRSAAPFTERDAERPLNAVLNGSTSGLNGAERSLNAECSPAAPPLPHLPVHLRSAPKLEFVAGVLDHLAAYGWEPSQANVRAIAEEVDYEISRGWVAAGYKAWAEARRG